MKRLCLSIVVMAGLLFCGYGAAVAQSPYQDNIEVDVQPKSVPIGESFQMSVAVKNPGSISLSDPAIKSSKNFDIDSIGESKSTQIINGRVSREVEFTYRATPSSNLSPGKYKLPDGRIVIEGETIRFSFPEIEISKASAEHSGVQLTQLLSNDKPYIGEQIVYSVEIVSDHYFRRASLEEAELTGFWREDLGRHSQKRRRIDRRGTTRHSIKEVLFPLVSGKQTIPVRKLTASVKQDRKRKSRRSRRIGSIWNSDPFAERYSRYVSKNFMTSPIEVDVRPLPANPELKKGQYVPVGTLTVDLAASGQSFEVGENIEMVLRMEGNSNLRPLRLEKTIEAAVSDFRFYPKDDAVVAKWSGEQINYEKAVKFSLVPKSPGKLTLPPIEIIYFDPKTESYKKARTKELNFQVSGPLGEQVSSIRQDSPVDETPKTDLLSEEDELNTDSEDEVPSELRARQPLLASINPLLAITASLLLLLFALSKKAFSKNPAEIRIAELSKSFRTTVDTLKSKDSSSDSYKEKLQELKALIPKLRNDKNDEVFSDLEETIEKAIFSKESVYDQSELKKKMDSAVRRLRF